MNRKARRQYFKLHVKSQKTSAGYLQALRESPHKEHQDMAEQLAKQFNELIGDISENSEEL